METRLRHLRYEGQLRKTQTVLRLYSRSLGYRYKYQATFQSVSHLYLLLKVLCATCLLKKSLKQNYRSNKKHAFFTIRKSKNAFSKHCTAVALTVHIEQYPESELSHRFSMIEDFIICQNCYNYCNRHFGKLDFNESTRRSSSFLIYKILVKFTKELVQAWSTTMSKIYRLRLSKKEAIVNERLRRLVVVLKTLVVISKTQVPVWIATTAGVVANLDPRMEMSLKKRS